MEVTEKVLFTGFRMDIPQITAIFDIACLPSLFEGMGRVLLEAQVSGKPVVATKVGGIAEIVRDGETGILVPPADPRALAEAIITLLKDETLMQRMSKAARQRMSSKFSSQEMVRKVSMVYQEFAGKKLRKNNYD